MRKGLVIGGLVVVIVIVAVLAWRILDSRQITTGATIPNRLGEQIAFLYNFNSSGEADLYVVDIENGTPIQLTKGQTTHSVTWLPDGDSLSFLTANNNLYTLNVITGELILVRQDVGEYAWSPDGTRLTWLNIDVGYLLDSGVDGDVPQRNRIGGRYAAWSPDGTRLAYIYEYDDDEYDDSAESLERDLTIIQVDGSGAQRIEREGQQSHPKWSLDGRYLLFFDDVFHAQGGLMGRNLMLYDLETGEFTDLRQFVGEGEFPDWSQDSQTLLFQQADGQVCQLSLSGEVGKCEGVGSQPIWNADNILIAYERDFGGGELCMFSLNVPEHGVDRCFFDWDYQVVVVGWRP